MPELMLASPYNTSAPPSLVKNPDLLLTPVDEYFIPLSVLPGVSEYPVRKKNHHHSFHFRDSIELQDPPDCPGNGGKAVRYARLEWLPKFIHARFHEAYGGLERLPQSREEKFIATVLAHSGYLPEEGIDVFSGSAPIRVPMSPFWRQRINILPDFSYPGLDGQDYKRRTTGQFLAEYIVGQDLQGIVSNSMVEEFLETQDANIRSSLGRTILIAATREVLRPIDNIHRQAQKEKRIIDDEPSRKPFVVVTTIFARRYRPDYLQPLRESLIKVS